MGEVWVFLELQNTGQFDFFYWQYISNPFFENIESVREPSDLLKMKFDVKHRDCLHDYPNQRLMIKCLTIIQIRLEFGNVGF